MFYGNFSAANGTKFREALSAMRPMFGRVHAADNLITFDRSAGFFADAAFSAAMSAHGRTASYGHRQASSTKNCYERLVSNSVQLRHNETMSESAAVIS
jgi:hypothetical protein